jgi:hypothetical protein
MSRDISSILYAGDILHTQIVEFVEFVTSDQSTYENVVQD